MKAAAACCFVLAVLVAAFGSGDQPDAGSALRYLAPFGTAFLLAGLGIVLWRRKGRTP